MSGGEEESCQDGCVTCCKTEFKVSSFLLSHDRPSDFVLFQCGGRIPYLAWRVFWALYHVIWIILTGVYSWQWAGPDPHQQVKWFIYLTDWCYFMLTFSSLLQLACVIYVNIKRKDIVKGSADEMPVYLKVNWVFFNVSNVAAITVSLLYWSMIYNGGAITPVNAETHAINFVYSILNLMVCAFPVRILHFFHGMLYGLTYVLFSLFYQIGGGTNEKNKNYIYSVLDWSKTGNTAMIAILTVFVAIPIIHLVLYGLYRLRLFVCGRCCYSNVANISGQENKGLELSSKDIPSYT